VDDGAKRRYGGAGLRLALVNSIVEALGGRISPASQVDVAQPLDRFAR
jgi:signal transduction histidine kinase